MSHDGFRIGNGTDRLYTHGFPLLSFVTSLGTYSF